MAFYDKYYDVLRQKSLEIGLFMYIPVFSGGIPEFEPHTLGILVARARIPEWGLGFRNSGLFPGLSASL